MWQHLIILVFTSLLLSSVKVQKQNGNTEQVADAYTQLLKKEFTILGLSALLDDHEQSSDLWSKNNLFSQELVDGKKTAPTARKHSNHYLKNYKY